MRPSELLAALHTAEKLKDTTRHCWTPGNRHESVADHSWRLALAAFFLRDEFPDTDMDKVIKMCLIHDLGECFTGDIPSFLKSGGDEERERSALETWVASLPAPYSVELKTLYAEMDALETDEARLYKALDKLEGDTLRTMLNDAEASVKTAYPNVRVEATPEVLQYENVAYSMPSSLTQLIVKSAKECSLTLKPRSERGGTTSAMMAAKGLRGGPCLYSGQQAEHSVYEWTCVEDMLQMTDVAEAIVRNIAREGGSFYIK